MQLAADAGQNGCRVPRLAPGWEPSEAGLSPAEGFLLSRIDGQTPWTLLRQIGGLPPDEVDRCLERWLAEGIVLVAGAAPSEPAKPGIALDAIDPDLDLAVELQRDILEFEAGLARPYHDLLGVPRNADTKAIKRAYFSLSKRYHPDRYYRRQIGGYAERLSSIFKKVVEAYELLRDPTTRAELERSLPPEAPVEPQAPTGPPTAMTPRRELLQRLRRQFRIPEQILRERRFKARKFFEASQLSAARERWREAAASVRLAIAFDPWCEEYKHGFAEVQSQVQSLRAAELLDRSGAGWDASAQQEAMQLYEEALAFRPRDPQLNQSAALLALEMDDLESAREYAEAACEADPAAVAHLRTLARVLRRSGDVEEARKVIEKARKLDPKDPEIKEELMRLRRQRRR